MIVLIDKFGGHSNRLFQSAHFEAYCLEHRRRFIHLSFEDLKELYGLKPNHLASIVRIIVRGLAKCKIIQVVRFYDEQSKHSCALLLSRQKLSFVDGWFFRCPDLAQKYRSYLRRRYSLSSSYIENNAFIEQSLSKNNAYECIVGVHIRRRDYRIWNDGKYCFEDNVFISYIFKMESLLNSIGKAGKYIIFSDESVSFQNIANITTSNEPWFIDHYIMSNCDFLMGPPSTFTGWASFMGSVPLLYMTEHNPNFSLNDFVIR
jgi:hypothetical protein